MIKFLEVIIPNIKDGGCLVFSGDIKMISWVLLCLSHFNELSDKFLTIIIFITFVHVSVSVSLSLSLGACVGCAWVLL